MSYLKIEHPEHPEMFAEVIKASEHPITSDRVYSMRLRYPRFILPEMNTHRVFSRNTRSSRAVPLATMLAELKASTFIPWHWQRNQPGMQGVADLTPEEIAVCEAEWIDAANYAIAKLEKYIELGIHKQHPNRLIEPFAWTDTLVTSTQWNNFLHLRDHDAAEPHLRDLAKLVGQALEQASVHELAFGEWHLPYITDDDWKRADDHLVATSKSGAYPTALERIELLRKISAARCARISYAPFDGNASFERELERYNSLVSGDTIHASPMEHQCTPDRVVEREHQTFDATGLIDTICMSEYEKPHLHGPLTGFIQSRKLIPGEFIHG